MNVRLFSFQTACEIFILPRHLSEIAAFQCCINSLSELLFDRPFQPFPPLLPLAFVENLHFLVGALLF
jgi:hypothetical protein